MNYAFHPAAEAEFLDSVSFYNSKISGLGEAFIVEFEILASLIGAFPKGWQIALEPNVRKAPLNRFPLSIVYREYETGFQVLAVAHDKRRPQYWHKRL